MEVSALRYSGGIGLHARSPLLRLQSDERLVALIRRGSTTAFEVLVSRYHSRLLAFCRHLLGSREDAEDVLQEVFSAAFNALLDDDRPINVRPWLYRIARNRSLNHLRRIQAVGVDSMDIHLSDHGTTTADKVHEREEFRLLVGDIHKLPETQRTALVLREMDALSYEQIAEAMETTVPSVKSLLVRARVSLAEAAQARMLTCDEVRVELGEVAEGLQRRPGALVRRHLRTCERCSTFKSQLNDTSKQLAALLPIGLGPMMLLRKLAIFHIGHSAGAGAGAGSSASGASAAGQAAAVGSTAAAGATAVMGSSSTGFISASVGAIATKAAAGLAAAALVTAGAVEVDHSAPPKVHHHPAANQVADSPSPSTIASTPTTTTPIHVAVSRHHVVTDAHKPATKTTATTTPKKAVDKPIKHATTTATTPGAKSNTKTKTLPGRTQTQTAATVLPASTTTTTTTPATTPAATCTDTSDTATTPTTTASTTATTPAASSDSGDTTSTSTETTATTPDTTSTDPTTTSTPTTSTTSTTPAPAPAGDSPCASDTSGGSSPAPSGGAAP
ncbi:MAG TPA: RNA polymerase sigma factor [Solirubrobacteraceae bacterium]|nr:RNA polymerase sigma factor [Solirubrobacteraceae bacterium]